MRRWVDAVLVIFCATCFLAGTALAAETSSPLPGLEVSWPKLIVAILGLLGLLERVRDWVRRYRQHVAIVYNVVEEVSGSSAPEVAEAGAIIKRRLRGEFVDAPTPLKDMALLAAVRAEGKNGSAGSAIGTFKREAGRVILRTVLRLIPVIGRFF